MSMVKKNLCFNVTSLPNYRNKLIKNELKLKEISMID